MPSRALLIEVRLLDGRYHGVGDWPPSPFRLFQALVAGAYGGRWRAEPDGEKDAAFRWLEGLAPPHIAAPPKIDSRATTYFVPNNDSDAIEGDPRRVSEIRSGKLVRPILLAVDAPFTYAWPFDHGEEHAQFLCGLANRLHTLGYGIDAAFARAKVCDWDSAEARLADHPGSLRRPGKPGRPERDPFCPVPGSLQSLKARHAAGMTRFERRHEGRPSTLFNQPPKALARAISYDRAPARLLFDLRSQADTSRFAAAPQEQASRIAILVRDLAARRLKAALPSRIAEIERLVIGREAEATDIPRRIRIVPLPSIGRVHTSPSIRRVLVEIPPDCPFSRNDLAVALANQAADRIDGTTGEVLEEGPILIPAADDKMLEHYGVGSRASRCWQTVTPAALPNPRQKGRIHGSERVAADQRAAAAVADALRHCGLDWRGIAVRVQTEPFRRAGARADAFEADRFARRLRHVEITFPEPVSGLLAIGDGRWLGLGLMAPGSFPMQEAAVFAIPKRAAIRATDGPIFLRAVRRALMALSRRDDGSVPRLFSGHEPDGKRAVSGRHEHVFLAADDSDDDGNIDRLIVAAPWACDRSLQPSPSMRRSFEEIVSRLEIVRAGGLGVIALDSPTRLARGDALMGPACVWESRTPYLATRHAGRRKDPAAAVADDMAAECVRRGLARPEVKLLASSAIPNGGGLTARAQLRFATAVLGPLLLGRDSHVGGGLFAAGD